MQVLVLVGLALEAVGRYQPTYPLTCGTYLLTQVLIGPALEAVGVLGAKVDDVVVALINPYTKAHDEIDPHRLNKAKASIYVQPGANPHPSPLTLHPSPVTRHPSPFTLHPSPSPSPSPLPLPSPSP